MARSSRPATETAEAPKADPSGIDMGDAPAVVTNKGPELMAMCQIVGALGKGQVIHKNQKFFLPDSKERDRLRNIGAVRTVEEIKADQEKVNIIVPK